MSFEIPRYRVETDWLETHLLEPDLRILDATVFLRDDPDQPRGYRIESGRAAWTEKHIPGSNFADLTHELADQASEFSFMLPPTDQFARAMSHYGVGDGTRVVLYDRDMNMWAARLWWMLRAFGFNDAVVLNGGWQKWQHEGRPVSSESPNYPPAQFISRPQPGLFANKQEVLAALQEGKTCLMNALSPDSHREQRIPDSVNVPARGMVDPETHAYLPLETLRQGFKKAKVMTGEKIITYCGGGISASSSALILTMLGVENVAVYDGSMSEWTADPAMPLARS